MTSIKMRINSKTSGFSMHRFLIVLLLGASVSEAFVPTIHRPSSRIRETHREINHSVLLRNDRSRIPRRRYEQQSSGGVTKLQFSWEDIVYNAESAAKNLADVSLGDPTNLLTSLPIMYGAGLLTSFSPCVWGLLPLTMSYISTAAGEREDQQTTLPTLAFAAGLAVVFCSLGVTAVELGGVFGGSSSTSMFLPIFSNGICLVMGLQLLGLVELPSLDVLSGKVGGRTGSADEPVLLDGTGRIIDGKRKEEEEGSLLRTFLLGGTSALVASPCATPVLTSILGFVAAAKNPALGALLLLGYTLGYSTPLLLVASTGGKALVDLRQTDGKAGLYAKIAPWVTPLTAGVLLWYGTNGMLTSVFGDPSMAGLTILE